MPIYEYRCESCGHTLDWLQKVSDPPLSDCPACSKPALKRLISAPSFRLKGSGWYETDFKSDKDKRRNLAESAKGDSSDKSNADGKGKDESKAKADGKDKSGDKAKSADAKPKKDGDTSKPKPDKKAGKGSEAA